MPRSQRAKQFAPFDALKGLRESLKIKEYEHEKIVKGDLSEEKVNEISNILLNLKKNDVGTVKYFYDGYVKQVYGTLKLDYENNLLCVVNEKINLMDILDIVLEKKSQM